MNNDAKKNIKSIVNIFEQDSPAIQYDKVYIYKDGPKKIKQVTLSAGFTQYGGNLGEVLKSYCNKNGKYSDSLLPYCSKMKSPDLVNDKQFLKLLVSASKEDSLMQDAQDEVFDIVYWNPAEKWFITNGFKSNLSMGIIFDSYVHSGSVPSFLRKKFDEKTPINSGDEQIWIKKYVDIRYSWLHNNVDELLRNTACRMTFFKTQIDNDNWELKVPLSVKGVKIN